MSDFIKDVFDNTDYQHLVVSAGVDWITLTGETAKSREKIAGYATTLVDAGMEQGQRLMKTSRNGYHLTSVEGIQWGMGSRGWMVCLSGETARRYWMSFFAYAARCTRLDLQTTIAYRFYTGKEIVEAYNRAVEDHGNDFLAHATLIQNELKGSTLYYGSRTSAQMGRVYDKAKQSKGDVRFDKCVRFEVELKKPLSSQYAAWLCEQSPDDKGITDKVLGWFFDRGIPGPPVYTYSDSAIQFPSKETSIERKLGWLRTTVRSTYQQLKLLGFQTEADVALGVVDDIQTVNQTKIDRSVSDGSE